jgi:hypothetical protein
MDQKQIQNPEILVFGSFVPEAKKQRLYNWSYLRV